MPVLAKSKNQKTDPPTDVQTGQLTAEQRSRWDELDGVVRRGARVFYEVGQALGEIRDEGLYRGEFDSLEERNEIYRTMTAAGLDESILHRTAKGSAMMTVRALEVLPGVTVSVELDQSAPVLLLQLDDFGANGGGAEVVQARLPDVAADNVNEPKNRRVEVVVR